MITILVDHNIEGNVISLWGILAKDGWADLIPMKLVTDVTQTMISHAD
jgi:hypothetical protein